MRLVKFKIPIYMWDVTVFIVESKDDLQELSKFATKYDLPDKEELINLAKNDAKEGGKTYTKRSSRNFVIILFPHNTKEGFVRTINHEKRHVIDDILEWHDIKDKEAAAYLDGYVSEELYKHLKILKEMKK